MSTTQVETATKDTLIKELGTALKAGDMAKVAYITRQIASIPEVKAAGAKASELAAKAKAEAREKARALQVARDFELETLTTKVHKGLAAIKEGPLAKDIARLKELGCYGYTFRFDDALELGVKYLSVTALLPKAHKSKGNGNGGTRSVGWSNLGGVVTSLGDAYNTVATKEQQAELAQLEKTLEGIAKNNATWGHKAKVVKASGYTKV